VITLLATAFAADVQRWAVVVGTNTGLPADEPLVYAESDAERVASVLEDLGDVRSEDIVSLHDVDADRVRAALDELARRVERRRVPGDEALLYFYYSGHGDEDGLRLSGTELPFAELTELLQRIPVDVRVLVVDACQSGELTRLKGAMPAEPFEIHAEDRLDTEGMAIIASSSVGEDAQESDRLQGGVFTHHFLTGLMGAADASADKRVTLTEAFRYGYVETVRSTSKARFVQRPSFGFQLSGRSDLVLTRMDEPGRNAALALEGSGQWLLFEGPGEGDLVAELNVDGDSLVSMAPGAYLIRHRNERGIREAAVDLPRGETLPLDVRDMTVIPPGQTVRKGLEDRTASVALTIGGGLIGPTSPGLGFGPLAHAGLSVDFEPMSLAVRVLGSRHRATNDQVRLDQARVGFDVAGIKKVDTGPLSFGLGVRAGVDATLQWFDTPGEAPSRKASSGRVGPVLSAEIPFGRTALVLSPSTDVQLYRRYDAVTDTSALETQVVPTLSLELAHHVR
jgi:hypothetical protein